MGSMGLIRREKGKMVKVSISREDALCARWLYESGASIRDLMPVTTMSFLLTRRMLIEVGTVLRPSGFQKGTGRNSGGGL